MVRHDKIKHGNATGLTFPQTNRVVSHPTVGYGGASVPPMPYAESIDTEYESECSDTNYCLLYTSPSPRDQRGSRMPSSA